MHFPSHWFFSCGLLWCPHLLGKACGCGVPGEPRTALPSDGDVPSQAPTSSGAVWGAKGVYWLSKMFLMELLLPSPLSGEVQELFFLSLFSSSNNCDLSLNIEVEVTLLIFWN